MDIVLYIVLYLRGAPFHLTPGKAEFKPTILHFDLKSIKSVSLKVISGSFGFENASIPAIKFSFTISDILTTFQDLQNYRVATETMSALMKSSVNFRDEGESLFLIQLISKTA